MFENHCLVGTAQALASKTDLYLNAKTAAIITEGVPVTTFQPIPFSSDCL